MEPAESRAAQAGDCLSEWILRACPDGLWVLDDEARTAFANAPMAALLGLDADQVIGLSAYDALDKADRSAFRDDFALRHDAADPPPELGLRLRGPGGRAVPVVLVRTPLIDGGGGTRGWLYRATPFTDQRVLLEHYAEREAAFLEAQHIAKIGSWDRDITRGGRTWSDELFRVYGLDKTTFEPSYEAFLDRVHPDDRAQVSTSMSEALAGNAPFAADFRLQPDVGALKWIRGRGRVTRDKDGNVVRMRGTSQDITESKDNENALAFLSALGRAANGADTLRDLLAAADAIVLPYAQWPPVLIAMPSVTDGDDGVVSLVDLEGGDATQELRAAAHDLAVRALREQRVVEAVGPTGTVLVAGAVVVAGRLACALVSDSGRRTAATGPDLDVFGQMITMLSHVAEREWTAVELATARDDALSASIAKSDFLATMSHEIRTPLNGVIGLSELLGTTELTPHQRRLAAGVDQAGRTLLALVNDVLDLSKIEAGRLELEEVDFDPRAIIEQSVSLVADAAREKHLELVVSSAVDVPDRLRGDPVRFGQVITNLAANAVKFTSVGEVVIRATAVGTARGVTELRVEVSDTGIGIAPDAVSRLFDSFTQADTSTTRQYGGTGLGLAISRRIVAAMHGEIGVRHHDGPGTTFWFTAELEVVASDGPSRDEVRENAVAGLRVLIVDDNETNRFILTEKLTGWRVVVKSVESAYLALIELDTASREDAPYDIVLLDYMMPGADGEQLARIIRAEPRHENTRLALLSSGLEPSTEFLAAAGIDLFLSKPVLASPLLETLVVLGGGLDVVVARPEIVQPAPTEGTAGRILVVEDNPVNQLVAQGVLERLGYAVVVADDGAAGLAAFSAESAGFDAVLMDCQMPVMDGYAATRAIRSLSEDGRRIPIIAMTAAAVADERERCLAAGMDDFLLKPVDHHLLRATLERWMTRGGPLDPAVLEPGQQPQLNQDRLGELLVDGAADLPLLRQILARFGARASTDVTDLSAAVLRADVEDVVRLAHGLRGSAANVGLVRLAERCEVLELDALDGGLPSVSALADLEHEVRTGVAELESSARALVRASTTSAAELAGAPRVPGWERGLTA